VNEGSANGADVADGVVAATSGDVLLEATAGDVVINAVVSSTTGNITITAGGNADLNATVTTGTDVLVTAVGNVSVSDNVTAGRDVSLVSTGADIDITAPVDAGRNVDLNAATSIDASATLHADNGMTVASGGTTTLTAAADITTGAGGLTMVVGQLTTAADITTASGNVSITGPVVLTNSITWTTMSSGSGADITVDGTIDGTTDFVEDLTLTAGAGDIRVTGNVGSTTKLGNLLITQADDVTFDHDVNIENFTQQSGTAIDSGNVTTFGGAVQQFGTDTFRITTDSVQFLAGTASLDTHGKYAIFTIDALTLPTTFLNATGKTVTIQTLQIGTSIGLEDASQDLHFTDTQLDKIHGDNIVIGSATQTGGIKIGTDGAITQDENYLLLTATDLTVNGRFALDTDHTLTANVGNDLTVNIAGRLETVTGAMTLNVENKASSFGLLQTGSGVMTLDIGHDLSFGSASRTLSTSGDVTMTSGTATAACDGALFMANGAIIDAGNARITLTADDVITLGQVITTNNTADAVRVTSNCAAIMDGGDTGTANIVAESANARVTLRAVTGIGSAGGPASDAALETSVANLDAVNATNHGVTVSGDVRIDEVNANGFAIRQIDQQGTGVVAVTSQGTIVATALSAGGGGIHARAGSILVSAENNTSDLDIRAALDTTGGAITLKADDDIIIGESGNGVTGLIRSLGGNVTVLADDDANADAGSGGELFMRDGSIIDAGSGTVEMRADGNITLGSVRTTNATGNAVTLITRSGAVVDGGDADRDIVADSAGAIVTISAITGIGSGDALETIIATLNATNAGSGNIRLGELNAITLQKISQSGGGRVDVITTNGTITVDNAGAATNAITVGTTGTLLLDANGAASNIAVNDGIQTASGAITLLADDNLTFDAPGDVTTTSGNVTLTADQDNGGAASGAATMVDGAVLNAGSGTITITADGSITIGSIQTTNATTSAVQLTSREGRAVDGGDTDRDIIASTVGSQVTINTVTGVGSGNALETTVSQLSVHNTGSGGIQIDNVSGQVLTIGSSTTPGVNGLVNDGGSSGNIRVTNDSSIVVAGPPSVSNITIRNSTGGSITLIANGAASDITVNSAIAASGGNGNIALQADRDIVVHDTGVTNDISLVGTGTAALTAVRNVVLGSQDPNTTSDVAQHTVANDVVVQTGTGSITNTLPLIYDIQAPQINALGEVDLTVTIGRPGETNLSITIFWGDGTVETFPNLSPGTYTHSHAYLGNPNPADQSAPILINMQVAHDPHVVLTAQNVNTLVDSIINGAVSSPPPVPAQNLNADLSNAVYDPGAPHYSPLQPNILVKPGNEANPGQVVFQDTTIKATTVPVPGEGLASFVFDTTPPVVFLTLPESSKFIDLLQQSGVQLTDGSTLRIEGVRSDESVASERLVSIEVLAPGGGVQQRILLSETVLDDMLETIGRLPDGKYRFQLQEPGEERQRLLLEFEVRQGKIADETDVGDRPPSAAKTKLGVLDDDVKDEPADAEKAIEAAGGDDAAMLVLPPAENPFEGEAGSQGESSVQVSRFDDESHTPWNGWSSVAARRAWKRAERVADDMADRAEWSTDEMPLVDETPAETIVSSSSGDEHALAGGSVMLIGAAAVLVGATSTATDVRQTVQQVSAKLSRAARLFRKYSNKPR